MIRHAILWTLFLLLLALPATISADVHFGPYLQSLSPHSVSVCAAVDPDDDLSVRLIERDGNFKEIAAAGTTVSCAVFDNLAPDHEYRYSLIVNGAPTEKEPHPFIVDATREMTFVLYGDTRSGDRSFDMAHRQVVRAIRESVVPDAICHTGDFVERGDDQNLWANFFHIENDILKSAPFFPTIGQSDQPPAYMRKIFPLLAEFPYYSFDRAGVHFVVLNLWLARSQPSQDTATDGAQAKWLRGDLAKARASGAKSLFVIVHESPFDIGGQPTKAAREVFIPIFKQFHVTAVFSGAHYFSHVVKDGVHYFTNGGGGALLDAQDPPQGVYRFFSAVHHFLVLEIGRTGSVVQALNARGDLFYEAELDQVSSNASKPSAPTTVKTFGAGFGTVEMTVFFRDECGDCETFLEQLPELARQTETTLQVTLRSLDDPNNRAALASFTDRTGPTPIVVLDRDAFVGLEQIGSHLASAVATSRQALSPQRKNTGLWILLGAVAMSCLVLTLALRALRKKQRSANRAEP